MSGDVGTSDETIGTTSDEDIKPTRIYSDIKPMSYQHHLYYLSNMQQMDLKIT